MLSCSFQGNKHSPLLQPVGRLSIILNRPKVVFSWVANASEDIYCSMHLLKSIN